MFSSSVLTSPPVGHTSSTLPILLTLARLYVKTSNPHGEATRKPHAETYHAQLRFDHEIHKNVLLSSLSYKVKNIGLMRELVL